MKIPLSWLKEYVDIKVPVEELAHRLTMAGTEMASIDSIGGWEHCFVAHVLKVAPHPNADRLTLCTVDIGERQKQVICGAPNVAQGQMVPFAAVGARLIDAHTGKMETLKAARIRGVVSEGMICSELELGIGENHDGIVVLPKDAPIGMSLSTYMGDYILDLDVTPNRPDCLSILGVAREVAALTGVSVKEPASSYAEESEPIEAKVSVEVQDSDLCYRYTATLISGVTVGPSPQWLQQRLTRAGMRPINNVVDVTNYVMLEYGQPLHAFDYHALKESKIIVRRARPSESLLSLDGLQRQLNPSMLVIADVRDPVALGGVIGGTNTEMADNTTSVLLESATFNATNNYHTAQSLRLRTEATIRFDKGLKPELAEIALRRATHLIQEVAGGVVSRGIIDIFPSKPSGLQHLTLTMHRLKKVLGLSLSIGSVERVLTSLGFGCHRQGRSELRVTVPYWRSDISIEDDLVEEVARIIGYEQVPTTMLSTPVPYHQPQPLRDLKEEVRDALVSCGMQEVITYPLLSHEALLKAKALDSGPDPLKVANPLSSQQEYLRTDLRPSLLATLALNQRSQEGSVCIFEVGRVYLSQQGDLPHEKEMVMGASSDPRGASSWLGGEGRLDFFDAKGIVEALLERLGVTATYVSTSDPIVHPGRCASIVINGTHIGIVAEVHPTVVEAFDLDGAPVAMFELDLEHLLTGISDGRREYVSLSPFPSASRDLSMLADRNIPADKISQIIQRHHLVRHTLPFDVYTGENIPTSKRSLAFRICFQSYERTLTSEEVNDALQGVVNALEQQLGITVRGLQTPE